MNRRWLVGALTLALVGGAVGWGLWLATPGADLPGVAADEALLESVRGRGNPLRGPREETDEEVYRNDNFLCVPPEVLPQRWIWWRADVHMRF